MNYFPTIRRWFIPEAAFHLSRQEMAQDGRLGNEGISLWLGTKAHGEARLTHLVFLRGDGVRRSPRNIQIAPELMHQVHDRAVAAGVILIGQIHSHGKDSGVNLSFTDKAYGVHVPHYLSVVCPEYAQNPFTTMAVCGVHVFLPERGYVRLSSAEARRRVLVIPEQPVETIIVSDT
jgi:hypothetical protein